MNRDSFQVRYEADWRRFEDMLGELERHPGRGLRRLGTDCTELGAFPGLYRQICHQLALARCRRYGADLESRLNFLALRGHQQLYSAPSLPWTRLVGFFAWELPRLVRSEARLFWVATALLYGPMLGLVVAESFDPELVYSVMGADSVAELESMYSHEGNFGRESESDFLMFGYYIYNNISVAFRIFASGLLLGIGSVFLLVSNGIYLGAVAGHINNAGYQTTFYPFVVGHGAFELTAIVLSGAAGLRLGLALVTPGRRSRGQALLDAARRNIGILYGIVCMLVVAAFLEAFWSSAGFPPAVRYTVGGTLWAAVAAYFTLVGRRRGP